MLKTITHLAILCSLFMLTTCEEETENDIPPQETSWKRHNENPVLRDTVTNVNYNYEVASDPHVFFNDNGALRMIYTGDYNEKPAIKLAHGNTVSNWTKVKPLLFETLPSGLDANKETAFYRKSSQGKHQIYYIGYSDEQLYDAQVFLAESDSINGEYTSLPEPIIEHGFLAGKNVYCITSPSIVEYENDLYITFIGWNDSPDNVTEVWIIGAKSTDEGYSWSDFQLVDAKIGMEGQITKTSGGEFIAVRTGQFENKEGIYYSTASHPFGPYQEKNEPILVQAGAPYEKDEIIAPQITINPQTNEEYMFYTGADHMKGWWIMLATKN